MPRSASPDPIKYCEQCGDLLTRKRYNGRMEDMSVFLRRRYCDQKCFALGQTKDEPTLAALRKRSVKFRGDVCEQCGAADSLDVHHLDLNPSNNELSNLMTLCGSCHTKWHWEHGKQQPKQQLDCAICGKPSKGLNLCLKHYQRFKKYGDPLLTMKKNGSQYELVRVSE